MHLRDLPNDILHQVFKEATRPTFGLVRHQWKHSLRLLTVCRRWRHVALSAVHSRVYFQYGSLAEVRSHARSGAGGEPESPRVLTNLGAVASAGCTNTVKTVSITIYYAETAAPGLDAALAMMRAGAERWRGAKALEVVLHAYPRASGEDEDGAAARHDDDAARICAALASMLPAVCQLDITESLQTRSTEKMLGGLASHFAGQLCGIHSQAPIALPPDCTLRRLRRAAISCSSVGDRRQPPRMDLTTLVSLEMARWPANHSWAPLAAGSGSTDIVFPSLEHLNVWYRERDAEEDAETWLWDETPWRIHFPKLKTMTVASDHNTCLLLRCMVLPPHMDKMHMDVPAPVLLSTPKTSLPHARGTERLELVVRESLLSVPPEAIPALVTRLEMRPPIGVDSMLALIRRLPRLATLMLWRLEFDDIQADISVPGPDEYCFVEPLSARIECLCLNARQEKQSVDMLVAVAKYLMLGVPTLADFRAPCIPRAAIMEFVDAYSAWHPHLSDIAFALDDSCLATLDPGSGKTTLSPVLFFF
ncbi:hypothetical protein H4R18_000789 [Coemansia javaensis]|uniref:F-box domain-containing protein n=1 Tax=Coemansia javaensis TaxID=2761396 RepID=A0A9W8HFP3_9FUNG|nr:hypothetical protein H4R18_000789 [Coemansia javaensis]